MGLFVALLLLIIGFIMLVKGADWFVDGAAGIAAKFGIPQLIIGLTIVAMGTSVPEAAVSIAAGMKGSADITIGNIIGSNILNILLILGVSAGVATLAVGKSTIRFELPFMIACTVLLLLMGIDGRVTLFEGVILWICFIAYLSYLFIMAKKNKEESSEEEKNCPWWKLLILTIGGLILVIWGSNVTVNAASEIASILGVSERIIGLTIVAFGTSLPELVTSVLAARKNNVGIAIGNIVGSNVFNILFVVGTTSLILPIPFAGSFRIDCLIAIASAVLLFFFCWRNRQLNRKAGVVMLVSYTAYFAYLIAAN